MTQLILLMILAYGLSNIIVYGSIFNGVRRFIDLMSKTNIPIIEPSFKFIKDMTSCMMCTGFHVGWFLSITIFSPTSVFLGTPLWISWFFDSFLSSGAVWAINSIIEWFEQNRPNNNNQIL